jgi:hypothetical protein
MTRKWRGDQVRQPKVSTIVVVILLVTASLALVAWLSGHSWSQFSLLSLSGFCPLWQESETVFGGCSRGHDALLEAGWPFVGCSGMSFIPWCTVFGLKPPVVADLRVSCGFLRSSLISCDCSDRAHYADECV